MHEDSKIAEAEYFLQRLAAVTNDPAATRYEASAFLSAARSVLQYALEESWPRSERKKRHRAHRGKAWYDGAVSVDPVVKFLKENRDINTHERPFPMRTHTSIGFATGVVGFSGTGIISAVTNGGTSDENRIQWPELPPQIPPRFSNIEVPPTTTYRYEFKDWVGPEDVLTLCSRYLAEIKGIVADGRARGFLTP